MRIDIYFGNEIYGCRHWDVVPRVGDCIAVDGPKANTYQVIDIIWAGDHEPQILMTLADNPA